MKTFCLLISFAAFLAAGFSREAETAPAAINAHFSWCGEARSVEDKLKRYEEFWKDRLPNDDGYDDQPQVTYVRKCAYRLASLYALTGRTQKCRKMLTWLEERDDAFPENVK